MLLTAIIFLPVLFAIVLWLWPRESHLKALALLFTFVEFLFSLALLNQFDPSLASLQLVEQKMWIDSLGITYFIGIDGLSLWLVLLTTFLTPLTLLGAWNSIAKKIRGFLIAMLMLEATMIGSFLSMDSVLFYIFFEASLIPMYFIIGIWGGHADSMPL